MAFLNISNHPKEKWSPEQVAAANELGNGNIVNCPFPNVHPMATTEEVTEMSRQFVAGLFQPAKVDAAMVQGEFSLTHELTRMLIALGWPVYVACSERRVEEVDGKKVVTFEFVQFRRIRD